MPMLPLVPMMLAASAANGQAPTETSPLPAPQDLVEGVPDDYPRFHFSGHDSRAALLSRYLWHHFHHRAGQDGGGKVLFNKEYLTLSDMWVAGAFVEAHNKSIQEVFRSHFLGIKLDPEGYVHTHQHFSHAHDYGWPFPLWTQVPGGAAGVTAGWHFQEDGAGWVWGYLKGWKSPLYHGESCLKGWELEGLRSHGLVEGKWRLEATGDSPALVTPKGIEIDALNAPFLQLRWKRSPEPPGHAIPYVEWLREGDERFGEDRRVHIYPGQSEFEHLTGTTHCITPMHRHPKWRGKIVRLRLALAPGESDVTLDIDSFFAAYDTRHPINNPFFILACWNYYRWTGDVDFLRAAIDRMRRALRHQQKEMGGLALNHIRNTWPGHDGRPGYTIAPDGSKTYHPGRGIGNNYWDLLPFGWDDMYATSQYYAATLVMAEVEEAIRAHPGWGLPRGPLALDPTELREHAAAVKAEANRKFWDDQKGRFVGWIDADGVAHDYGFTFVNLEAIWYGIASDDHARAIMDWVSGRRVIEGDTSTGEDIYRWRFGPRATTKRNVECYGHAWTGPEAIPWGGQIQDGGAVLGFSFFDLWARLQVRGPDEVWERLGEILAWEEEVWAGGGYREYYQDGTRGTTLQGGGTAGGLGIDFEFHESSLLPAIVVYGFLGLDPQADGLAIRPRLPSQCPQMGVSSVLYCGVRLGIKATSDRIEIALEDRPRDPLHVRLDGEWRLAQTGETGSEFAIKATGVYRFEQ